MSETLIREYRRPWKLCVFGMGMLSLIAGAFYYNAVDWDIPISFIMGILAYLTASWSMRVMVERRWRDFPLMLFLTWLTVDGSYWAYWSIQNPLALEYMRDVNFPASLSLYWMCGLVWYYEGTLKELCVDTKYLLHRIGRLCLR